MMTVQSVLDLPFDVDPDPQEYLRAAMRWHFDPRTGSPFWLRQAAGLGFDPITEITGFEDLARFPNLAGLLRTTRAEDLLPRGLGPHPAIAGVFDSGGTTGAPKRVVLLEDWLNRFIPWSSAQLDALGVPRGNWLLVTPSGPHMVGPSFGRLVQHRGGIPFTVDMDPRWVKHLIAQGRTREAADYTEHLVEQLAHPLRSQDIAVLLLTPPVLERITRRPELLDLIRDRVSTVMWVGTQMDPDARDLYRTEILPDTQLISGFGNTMMLGHITERPGSGPGVPADGSSIYDPFSPYMTISVLDDDGAAVAYGERGRVVMNHVSKGLLLPNNLERDYATRIRPLPGRLGDAVADIAPVKEFENQLVIEGVY